MSAQEAKDRLREIVEGFFFRRLRTEDAQIRDKRQDLPATQPLQPRLRRYPRRYGRLQRRDFPRPRARGAQGALGLQLKGAALHGMGSGAASPVRNDSPVEEAGFELPVPPERKAALDRVRRPSVTRRQA
jgi:hypothetical protein